MKHLKNKMHIRIFIIIMYMYMNYLQAMSMNSINKNTEETDNYKDNFDLFWYL